ncbi:MAG: HEPN domain-containing protein [Phycisphaerales bacterium]
MIRAEDVRKIAEARLEDANVLLASQRYDGAIYLCGYAVELALKAKICQTLNWAGYPSTSAEFRDYRSFQTHDLDVLLHLTGREEYIKKSLLAEWSAVAQWDPDTRYQPIGTTTKADVRLMMVAAATLLGKI